MVPAAYVTMRLAHAFRSSQWEPLLLMELALDIVLRPPYLDDGLLTTDH